MILNTLAAMYSPGILYEQTRREAHPSVGVLLIAHRKVSAGGHGPGAAPKRHYSRRSDVRGHDKHFRSGPMYRPGDPVPAVHQEGAGGQAEPA